MSSWTSRPEPLEGPLYIAIANQIAQAIAGGELRPGARLPTHRDLALRLGVSVHTVSQAYAEAERRGLVIGEIGRGTFVRPGREREGRFMLDRRSEDLVDLSINRPVYDHVHTERVRAALTALGERGDVSSMLLCRPIAGLDQHRAAGAQWLRRRSLDVPPERVLITNGVAHGLLVALATLVRPGDLVVTEALTDHSLIGLADVLGFRLRGLPIDAQGLLPDAFEDACASAEVKALCLTPTLSNPTVALMGDERRRHIAEVALRFGVPVVENDVYGLLAADPPPPVSAHLPEQSYYLTSFTKILVSGLRTGYLVGPERMISRLVRRIRVTSWMATPLLAEFATHWIADGTADELLAWQRSELAQRQAIAARVLAGFSYASHPHALHIWLVLPEPWRAEAFASEARLAGVAVTPAEAFVVGPAPPPHAIRISIGAARTRAQLQAGLQMLGDLLRREPEPFYMPT